MPPPPPASRAKRPGLWRLAGLLLIFAGGTSIAAEDQRSLEYPVKAAYLYKFAPFVEWPAGAHASAASPLVLCVVGDDPFGSMLDRAVAGQSVGERPIVVRRLHRADRDAGCHIMYVAGSAEQSVEAALRVVEGMPILTITDSADQPEAKGIVHFVIRDRRVRFQIDDIAAARNGIKISSKLLNLAVSVKPRAEEPLRSMACTRCSESGS